MDILLITLGILIPFIGTSIGSSFVYIFKNKTISVNLNKIFSGFAAGVMFSASIFGLILPALDYQTTYMPNVLIIVISFVLGFLLLLFLDHVIPHFHSEQNYEEGIRTTKLNKKQKMFLAILIHNIPEGLSTGVVLGVGLANLTSNNSNDIWLTLSSGFMIALGIAIQNIPEGAIVSLPFKSETNSTNKAFLYGVFSGIVEPIFAIIGLLLAYFIEPIMPRALAFAAGCMIYVTIEDLIPSATSGEGKNHYGIIAFMIGFILMFLLDFLLS